MNSSRDVDGGVRRTGLEWLLRLSGHLAVFSFLPWAGFTCFKVYCTFQDKGLGCIHGWYLISQLLMNTGFIGVVIASEMFANTYGRPLHILKNVFKSQR